MTLMQRKLFVLVLSGMLFSCAGNINNSGEDELYGGGHEHVNVDSDVVADFGRAVELMQQEKYTQAIELLRTVVEHEQRLPAPYVNLAIAYNKTGNTKEAEANLISALKLDIGHPVANNELGLLYRKAGKFKAARTAYANAISQHPDYLPVKRNLGVLCDLYLHDYQCALKQYEDYLKYQPDDKNAAIWVADVKNRLGQ